MIENVELPEELLINIGSESKEFAVKSSRAQPVGKSISRIIFGVVWLLFIGIFISFVLGLFMGTGSGMPGNETTGTAGSRNLNPGLLFSAFLGLFVLIGLFLLISGFIALFKKGGFYVGTSTRLIHYKRGILKSSDWEQFTGNIEIRGTSKNGNLSLEMRTGHMYNGRNGSRYVPDIVYMSGIPDVYEIEKICRRRIKEHDSSSEK